MQKAAVFPVPVCADPKISFPPRTKGIDSTCIGVGILKFIFLRDLFNLSKDPHQFMNISNDPSYQHIVSKYSQKLLSWHMDYPNRSLSYFQATAEGTKERRD